MAKQKRKKKLKSFEPRSPKLQARDAAYRKALGLADGAELPNTLGMVSSAGAGRDRRGLVGGAAKGSDGGGRPRAKFWRGRIK